MKSQAGTEYLMVIGFSLIILIPIIYYSLTISSDTIIISQAQDAVNTLAKATDHVYSFGTGSSTKVLISIPQNVIEGSIQNKTILLKVRISSGISDIKASTKANVSGNIPIISGNYNMFVNMTESDVVVQRG